MAHNMKINPQDLPPDVAKILTSFCEMLIWGHGRNLTSIAVYGSAISPNYLPKVSNINLLCIFKNISLSTLDLTLGAVKYGRKQRIAAPLFLTMDYIKSSLDTFPMEFLEIIEQHRTIYGPEMLDGLKVPREHLRLQCEQQIKSQFIRLRQIYLERGKNKKYLKLIVQQSLSTIFPIFRSLLRLANLPIPDSHEEVIMTLGSSYGFDGQLFVDILRDKKKIDRIVWKEIDRIYEDILNFLEVIANKVDRLKTKENA